MDEIIVNNYSKIKVGSSTTNIKTVFLKSNLNFGTAFVTEPFGTSKTRFQCPEMFTYSLIKINSSLYKLTIERNSKILCKTTAKYFWSDGWSIDLYVTNIPKCNIITASMITQILPDNYGHVDTTFSHEYKNKIGIVVPIFSRHNYLEQFFKSLRNSEMKDCLLILIDESLTKDVDEDKQIVNAMVKNFTFCGVNLIKIYKKNHGNMHDSILRGCDIANMFCQYIITIDSDTIHNKNWVSKLLEVYNDISINSNENVVISPFNTINMKRHTIKEEKLTYYIKNSIGGCCLLFNQRIYIKYIRCTLISHKWDTNLITNINNNYGLIAVTKPSVIDHIGFQSSGHRSSDNGTYDVALDFVSD